MKIQKKSEVEKMILELIETSPKLRKKLVTILLKGEDRIVTESYLDKQLAKQAEEFGEKLLKQREEIAKDFDEKLTKAFAKHTQEFDEKLLKQREEIAKDFDEKLTKAFAKHTQEFDEKLLKQREEIAKDFDEKLTKAFAKHTQEFDEKLSTAILQQNKDLKQYIDSKFGVIGSRWGKGTEATFREGLKTILEKEFNAKIVQKWNYKGIIPEIDPHRKEYEIDVYISADDKVILVEYKSSVDSDDVYIFHKNCTGYEYISKRQAKRKIIVCSYAEEKANQEAKEYSIDITYPADYN